MMSALLTCGSLRQVGGLNKQREERLLERFREMLDMEPYENGPEEPYM